MTKQGILSYEQKIDHLQKRVDNLMCLVYNASRKVKERDIGKRHRRTKK